MAENCFSQTAHNSSSPHKRLTSWVRAWVYTPSDWGGNPGLLPRLGVQDISSIHSSIKGRWQQQQPYFKREGRVLHLKIKCRGPVLEERVQSMKTQEQRSTLHALSPIDHSGILQSQGVRKLLCEGVRAKRCPPALSEAAFVSIHLAVC